MAVKKQADSIDKNRVCMGAKSKILKCNGLKTITNYNVSWSEFHDGYMPYCKDCCSQIFKIFFERSDENIEYATYYTCQKLDIPFKKEAFEAILESFNDGEKVRDYCTSKPNFISKYIGVIHSSKFQTDLDFSCSDSDLSEADKGFRERIKKESEVKELIHEWGKQERLDYYDFLQGEFVKITEGVNFVNNAQRELYKDYCRDRLILRRMNDDEYDGDEKIDGVRARVSKTMKELNINNFEGDRPKTLSEQSFFTKIKLIDEKNVADIYKDVKKDYDINKLEFYDKKFSLRPLGNMLANLQDFDVDLEDLKRYKIDE